MSTVTDEIEDVESPARRMARKREERERRRSDRYRGKSRALALAWRERHPRAAAVLRWGLRSRSRLLRSAAYVVGYPLLALSARTQAKWMNLAVLALVGYQADEIRRLSAWTAAREVALVQRRAIRALEQKEERL